MAGTKTSGNRTPHSYQGRQCGAKTRAGHPCRGPAMLNGRCRVHGGATPKGMDSPHWKTGRYSKYLGPVIRPLVDDMATDLDRFSMVQELQLIDARTAQVLARLGTAESETTWAGLKAALADFERAQTSGDAKTRPARMHAALQRVQGLVAEGAAEGESWKEVLDLIDRRRVLIESEERRALQNGKSIPADQVLNMLASISRLVLDEVTDPAAKRRINERLMTLAAGSRLPVARLPARMLEARS